MSCKSLPDDAGANVHLTIQIQLSEKFLTDLCPQFMTEDVRQLLEIYKINISGHRRKLNLSRTESCMAKKV